MNIDDMSTLCISDKADVGITEYVLLPLNRARKNYTNSKSRIYIKTHLNGYFQIKARFDAVSFPSVEAMDAAELYNSLI